MNTLDDNATRPQEGTAQPRTGPLPWMKSKASALAGAIVTSVWVGGFITGAIVLIVCAGFGATWLFRSGYLASLVPEPPAVVKPPDPIKIAIHGPSPAVVISGITSVFMADISGPAGSPEWSIYPPAAANATPSADGRRMDLLAAIDGKFCVVVTIAGDGRQLAKATLEVEAMAQVIQQPEPREPPPPVAPEPATPTRPAAETVAERMTRLLETVNSEDRAREGRAIANVLTSIVGRINAGAIGPHANIALLIRDESVRALGSASPKWEIFVAGIALVLDNFKNQGLITTAATTTPILVEISGVLLKAQ